MTGHDLEHLRGQMRRIDARLLELVARRQQVASKIGRIKAKRKLPVVIRAVEQSALASSRDYARKLGLREDTADELMKLLMKYARKIQRG